MNFTLAGFYTKNTILDKLLFLYEKHNYIFKESVIIGSLYDSLPNLKWNGGRIISKSSISNTTILKNIDSINKLGIGINFTFTNFSINKNDLKDKECNDVLKILSKNNLNGVIIASALLRDYIANKYPKLKITLSLTYFYNNIKSISNEIEKTINIESYDKIVLPPDYNQNTKLIASLDNRNKIELLINETCYKNCIYKAEHYKLISDDCLSGSTLSKEFCEKKHQCVSSNYALINNEQDILKYKNLGINNFKISGRSLKDNVYILFIYKYLIKSKYKDFFYTQISNKKYNPSNNIDFITNYTKRLTW
jgi:collagenase-like PrtC family protease